MLQPLGSRMVRHAASVRVAGMIVRHRSYKHHNQWLSKRMLDKVDEYELYIQKQKLLFKGIMQSKGKWTIDLRIFKFTTPAFSWSEAAGHVSFIFLALSYMEQDLMNLRLYALWGITYSILFQYYREVPLWIPIRWNILFMVINMVMVTLILKEETEAVKIPQDQRQLYDAVFAPKGMTLVDFKRLMWIARRREFKQGEVIVTEGQPNNELHLVQNGTMYATKKGQLLGTIDTFQFVGQMSYLLWEQETDAVERGERLKSTIAENLPVISIVLNQFKRLQCLTETLDWDELDAVYMDETVTSGRNRSELSSPQTTTTAAAAISSNTPLLTATAVTGSSPSLNVSVTNSTDNTISSTSGNLLKKATKAARRLGYAEGQADIKCAEDSVLYSWNFEKLRALLSSEKALALSFERCLSADLNRKITSTYEVEHQQRYYMLVAGATLGSKISAEKRELIDFQRRKHNITPPQHEAMLLRLGWASSEFKRGYRGNYDYNKAKLDGDSAALVSLSMEAYLQASKQRQQRLNDRFSADSDVATS